MCQWRGLVGPKVGGSVDPALGSSGARDDMHKLQGSVLGEHVRENITKMRPYSDVPFSVPEKLKDGVARSHGEHKMRMADTFNIGKWDTDKWKGGQNMHIWGL